MMISPAADGMEHRHIRLNDGGTAVTRVAIVDDSTVVRAMIGWVLEQAGMEVVATASNGRDAISALAAIEVDVLILDLEMPGMDGLSALPEILKTTSAPVLVVSSLTTHGAQSTIKALKLGAADTLAKPDMVTGGNTRDFGARLIEKVQALGKSKMHREQSRPAWPDDGLLPGLTKPDHYDFTAPVEAIAIAASTGGPSAMFDFFDALAPLPEVPIFVTQHLPASFVPILAEHLSRHAQRPAFVASEGQLVQAGAIHLAPGDAHLTLERKHKGVSIRLDRRPSVCGCCPSADPMFSAIADFYREGAVAILLSGMGRDGSDGARRIRENGGTVIAQDMQSSVVWGMPGVVCKQGTAHVVRPPAGIAALINSVAGR